MREVVIAGAARTPIGSFGGALAPLSAVDLGAAAAKAAIERSGFMPGDIEQVLAGNILSAGLGQNIARQIQLRSDIPESATAMTLNMVCGSGLRAVSLAALMVAAGEAGVVLAGGSESMSNAPYLLQSARWGQRMNDGKMVDSMVNDGLWDAFNDYHMGITAENLAERFGVTREAQDAFAVQSQNRAEAAVSEGRFLDEITPVAVPQRKGGPRITDTDEYPRPGARLEDFQKLKPAFKKDGTVTAGNASGVNDGAAMLVLTSKEKAAAMGLNALATVKSYATAGVSPDIMGYGVVPACRKAMESAGVRADEIDLVEANEAFAAQALCVARELGFDPGKTNVNGGAIALGHPIGASGARILVTLLYEMRRRDAKLGLATLCIGGGMGAAVIVER